MCILNTNPKLILNSVPSISLVIFKSITYRVNSEVLGKWKFTCRSKQLEVPHILKDILYSYFACFMITRGVIFFESRRQ